MADIADGDYTYDLPSYDARTMSSVGVTVNNNVGGNDRNVINTDIGNGNTNPTTDSGIRNQQMQSGNVNSGNGGNTPPERYASRDVELYASSFAPPPEFDKSAGAAANGHANGGDGYTDDEADYDDEDVSSLDVRVRRDVQRRFLTFFGAALLVSITIGFFVPFAQSQRDGNNGISDSLGLRGNEDKPADTKTQKEKHPTIPPPSSNLGDLCADASRTTDQILTRECFQACDKAMCCAYPSDDARNCVDATTEAICAAYDEACSQYGDDGYGIGDGDDGEEYLDGEMDRESNVGGTGNSNSQYRGQKLPMAPTHIVDTCSEDVMKQKGRAECEEHCVEYTDCCLEDFCQENNAEACETYQPCQILADEDIYLEYGDTNSLKDVQLTQAPGNLDEVCSPFALSSGGLSARADCTSICSEFEECCRDDACLASNVDACGTYTACENLLQPEMILDPSDIPTYCHGRGILTKEGIMACKALCEPGLCCLISPFVGKEKDGLLRGIESCVEDKGSDFCDMYSDCEILLDVDDENLGVPADTQDDEDAVNNEEDSSVIPLAPQNIEEICSKRSLMNIEKYRECKGVCTRARCCWSAEHYSCEKKTSTHRCDEYAPCSRLEGREPDVGDELFDDDDWDDETDGKYVLDIMEDLDEPSDAYRDEKTGFSNGSTVTKAKIDAACSTASVLTPSGEKVCAELCEPGACCYLGTCSGNAVKMNCSTYKACDIMRDIQREKELTGDSSKATLTSTSEIDDSTAKGILEKALLVQETCTESNVASVDGRKACERLCLSHLCCFAPENDCAESLGSQCLEYAACKHLIDWEDR